MEKTVDLLGAFACIYACSCMTAYIPDVKHIYQGSNLVSSSIDSVQRLLEATSIKYLLHSGPSCWCNIMSKLQSGNYCEHYDIYTSK